MSTTPECVVLFLLFMIFYFFKRKYIVFRELINIVGLS